MLEKLSSDKLGGAAGRLAIEELEDGWLRPGQSVAAGWQEVIVIKVVERTVIVGSALS